MDRSRRFQVAFLFLERDSSKFGRQRLCSASDMSAPSGRVFSTCLYAVPGPAWAELQRLVLHLGSKDAYLFREPLGLR